MTTIAPTVSPSYSVKQASTQLKVKLNAEKYFSWYLIGSLVMGIIFTFRTTHETGIWPIFIIMSILSAASFFSVKWLFPKSNLTLYLAGTITGLFNIYFHYCVNGWYGAHFVIFTSAIVLIAFQEWKVFIPTYALTFIYTLFVSYFEIYGIGELKLASSHSLTWDLVLYYQFIIGLFFSFCGILSNSLRSTTVNRVLSYSKLEEKVNSLQENLKVARELSSGNFQVKFSKEHSKDELSQALVQMANSLKTAKEKEDHDRFISTGLTEIGEILRQNMSDLNILCEKVIFSLVGTLEANQGGVFLVRAEKNGQEYLELNSSCAYNRKKFLEKRVELKESLLGQAYLEQSIIHIDDIPENYSSITSGLGETSPRHLIIVPLISNQKVIGVIEIASLKPFNKTKVEYFQKASESIASTIIFAKSNEETSKLLVQAEQMASELQAQEEEMRQNLEELQATQEEMKRAEKELKLKESNLRGFIDNTQNTIFALDTNYNITVVNSFLRNKYIARGIDLRVGKHIFDILPKEVHEYWKDRYDRVLSGERFNEVTDEGNDMFLDTVYNPIFNDDNDVIGASVVANDISERVLTESRLKHKEHELETIINQISSSILVLDRDFNVSQFNVVAQERLKNDGITIDLGANFIDCFQGHPLSQIWKSWIENVFQTGEKMEKSTNRGSEENPIFINVEIFPIRDLENNIIHVGIFGVDITADKVKMMNAQKELMILKQAFELNGQNTIIINNKFIPEFEGALATDIFDKNHITIDHNISLEESNSEEEISKLKTALKRAMGGNEFTIPVKELFDVTDEYSSVKFTAIKSEEKVTAVSISLN